MKRIMIVILLCFVISIAQSQVIFKDFKQPEYIVVSVFYQTSFGKIYCNVAIDDGIRKDGTMIMDENGKPFNFESYANAINYIYSLGYETNPNYLFETTKPAVQFLFRKIKK